MRKKSPAEQKSVEIKNANLVLLTFYFTFTKFWIAFFQCILLCFKEIWNSLCKATLDIRPIGNNNNNTYIIYINICIYTFTYIYIFSVNLNCFLFFWIKWATRLYDIWVSKEASNILRDNVFTFLLLLRIFNKESFLRPLPVEVEGKLK